jgi:eukaryotic translation initiation factor 2C
MAAGTVIDTTIVHPRQFDFYLNSHAGALGTNVCSYYHVLYNEIEFTSDELQQLTFWVMKNVILNKENIFFLALSY